MVAILVTTEDRVGSALPALILLIAFAPAAFVGLQGAGLPWWLGAAAILGTAVPIARSGLRNPSLRPLRLARQHPLITAVWVLVFGIAVAQMVPASLFADAVTRRPCSVAPGDQFR